MLLEENIIVRDVYEIERMLGEGAFAEVYRVKHKFLGKKQALKIIKLPGLTLKDIEEILDEAVILSRISHPNVISVFDAGTVSINDGLYGFFTMEYIAGGNLETFWRYHSGNFISLNDTIDIIRQVCRGLSVAHSENPPIIHRDIKPQNIMIGYDSLGLRVVISDFGLARRVNPLTLIASAKGTRGFKPPEFLLNLDSCAGDVWAIGTTLYLMLTDRLPYPAARDMDILDGSCWNKPLIPPSSYNIRVNEALDAIVFRSLALNPENRYPNAMVMLEDLMKYKSPENEPGIGKKEDTDKTKSAIGSALRLREISIKEKLSEALKLSKQANKLTEAADLLEEVLNQSPDLREKYENKLILWRHGVAM